jgi:integrase/recombinase XerD
MERIVGRLAGRAKIKKRVTPHTLRHSIATHLYEKSGDLKFVQKLLGHASIRSTQIYACNISKERFKSLYDRYRGS